MRKSLKKMRCIKRFSLFPSYMVICLMVLALLGGAYHAEAKSLPAGPVFNHTSNGETLNDLLKSFGAHLGIPITIDRKVKGKVNGQFSDRPTRFLNRLSSVYNLLWYYDGTSIYIYSDAQVKTEILSVKYISVNELRRSLVRLGILDARSKWQALPRQEVAYVSGPPRFVDLAVELTKVLDNEASLVASATYSIEVFPLRYTLAADREVYVRGKVTKIRGIASVLRNILQRSVVTEVEPPKNGEKSAKSNDKDNNKKEKTKNPPRTSAVVEANDRLNAVIISGRKQNMAMYSDLIEKLDQPSNQVEINVSILEVSTDEMSRLGLDMESVGTDGSASFGSPHLPIAAGGASTALPAQTVLIGKAGDFLGRVNMLAKEGSAKILSRPSVLTVDRLEAVIDNSETFHVRVAGKEDVELYPVTVGSMVKVTPRIVDEGDGRWIHLNVDIEDGSRQDNVLVDDIPVIKKSMIATSSIVEEDSSLLVGGYYYDKQSSGSSKVPLLGDIPILSLFFNWESDQSKRVARMFLITPRILGYKEKGNNVSVSDLYNSYKSLKMDQMPVYSDKEGISGEKEADDEG